MKTVPLFHSKLFHGILIGLGTLLVALIIFQAGVYVGDRKASFRDHFNHNYMIGLNDPHSVFAPFSHGPDDVYPHGVVGSIVSIRLPEIMIKGPNRSEQIVMVSTSTIIKHLRQDASISDMKAGDQVIVIGSPDEKGQVDASLIRILSTSNMDHTTSSSSPQKTY